MSRLRGLPDQWNTPTGRRLLRSAAAGAASIAAVTKKRSLDDWERRKIADAVRRYTKLRRQKDAPTPAEWSRSIAGWLDEERDLRVRRELALRRFDDKTFRGNREHLERLLESIGDENEDNAWNRWRRRNPGLRPDLRGAELKDMHLRSMDLRNVRLNGGNLSASILRVGKLDGADLRGVQMRHTDLSYASLVGANLSEAVLEECLLPGANLSGANLQRATIVSCLLNYSKLYGARLKDAVVWGASVWGVSADEQSEEFFVSNGELEPGDYDGPLVRKKGNHWKLDNIELSHYIALVSDNEKIGPLLRASARRLVLILGRFTGKEASVLARLREALPREGYAPIVFDFENDRGRDLIETVQTLAGLSRFVIADLTSPRSVPLEAYAIAPEIAIPFVPIIRGEQPFSMFAPLQRKYSWILKPFVYRDESHLLRSLRAEVIDPAERVVKRMERMKAEDTD